MNDRIEGESSPVTLKDSEHWSFRIYVYGTSQNSLHALGNIYDICRDYLDGHYDVEVVNLLEDPGRAMEDQILVTPTLIRLAPLPMVSIIGTLDQRELVLAYLGIAG